MSMTTAADVSLLVVSDNSRSERRVSPSWTIDHLKQRLEPITGVPATAQHLSLKANASASVSLALYPGSTVLDSLKIQHYAELHVRDGRPPGARENFTDVSAVKKYEMPAEEYEQRTDSVLAWKRTQKLGRFDPDAPSIEQQKIALIQREIDERGIQVSKRCRLTPESDSRRGTVRFIGAVPQIPGGAGAWVGIEFDEPTGKNDGSVQGTRYFECAPSCGVFVRPERVEVGDFPPENDFDDDEF